MKKHLLACLAMFLIVLTLAACGTANQSSNGQAAEGNQAATATPEATSQATDNNQEGTRLYKHALGETEIPANPKRVVTLQYVSQMLSVGVKPIGAVDYLLDSESPEFQGIESIGSDPVNYEKILELQPDLIIAADLEQEDYDRLTKIAPTVSVPWMDYDVFGHVEAIGDILNRQEEAAAWKSAFDEKIAVAREKVIGAIGENKTVAIYRIDPKEFYVYGVRNIGFTLYKALGLQPPAAVQAEIDKDANLWAIPISLEVLPQYDADYVFLTKIDNDETDQRFKEMEAGSIWKNLTSVKNDHVFPISMDTWLGYTPHDIEIQLDEAVKLLTGAE